MRAAYLILDAAFLAPCVLVQALAWRRRPPRHVPALLVTVVVLLALTVVFDSLMIAAGLFTYAPERISGIRIGLAPIEDLAYPLAAALLCSGMWSLGRRASRPAGGARHGDAAGAPEEARR